VAVACNVKLPVFVPGRIGEKAARRHFRLAPEQLIEVSNEWGFVLDEAAKHEFSRLLVLGHPGKLAKLAMGQWDTHSSRSTSAVPFVSDFAKETLGRTVGEARTVEGIFALFQEKDCKNLGDQLSSRIRLAVSDRLQKRFCVATILVDMKGEILGYSGEISWWPGS